MLHVASGICGELTFRNLEHQHSLPYSSPAKEFPVLLQKLRQIGTVILSDWVYMKRINQLVDRQDRHAGVGIELGVERTMLPSANARTLPAEASPVVSL